MRDAEEILKNYREKGYSDEKIKLIAKWRKEPVRTEIYNLLEAGGEAETAAVTADVEQSLYPETEAEDESMVEEENQDPVAEVEAEASQEQKNEEENTGETVAEAADAEPEEEGQEAQAEESDDDSTEAVDETTAEDEQEADIEPEKKVDEADEEQEEDEKEGTQRIEVKIETHESGNPDESEDEPEPGDEQTVTSEKEQEAEESSQAKETKYVEAELFDYSNGGDQTPKDPESDEEEIVTAVRLESRDEFDIRISGRDFVTDGPQDAARPDQSFDELEVIEEEAEPAEQKETDFHFDTYDKEVNDLEAPLQSQSFEEKHITRKFLELKERSERLEKTRTRLEKLVEEMSERLNERYNENQKLKTRITDYEENRGDSRELQKMLCKKQRRLNKINEMLGQREQELHRIREKYNRKILTSAYESQRKIKIYRAFACASWMAAGVLLVFSIIFDVNPGGQGEDGRTANTIAQMDNDDKLVKPVWDKFDHFEEEDFLPVDGKSEIPEKSVVAEQDNEQGDTDESVARVQKKVERKRKVRYVVQKGDSLWEVASKFYGTGHRYKEIARQNNIMASAIKPGDVIFIDVEQ